jgi:hypothetical protein
VTGERHYDLSKVPRHVMARLTDLALVVEEIDGRPRVRRTRVKGYSVIEALMAMAKIMGSLRDDVGESIDRLGERLDRAISRDHTPEGGGGASISQSASNNAGRPREI